MLPYASYDCSRKGGSSKVGFGFKVQGSELGFR